jgi:hypothetical protein
MRTADAVASSPARPFWQSHRRAMSVRLAITPTHGPDVVPGDESNREAPAHDPEQHRRAEKTTTRPPAADSAPSRAKKP